MEVAHMEAVTLAVVASSIPAETGKTNLKMLNRKQKVGREFFLSEKH
jgi:hypothetical protein